MCNSDGDVRKTVNMKNTSHFGGGSFKLLYSYAYVQSNVLKPKKTYKLWGTDLKKARNMALKNASYCLNSLTIVLFNLCFNWAPIYSLHKKREIKLFIKKKKKINMK